MRNVYSFGEIVKNLVSLIYTKIFFNKARLIRLPVYVRNKKYLTYGKGFTTGYGCRLEMFQIEPSTKSKLIIGENCKIGDYVHIAAGEKITIGDNCLFASKIYISDISHGSYSDNGNSSSPLMPPDKRVLTTKSVEIGSNVWLGENVCVLPGVSIGSGSIVGANAVVNSDIPENSIAVGVPAKVVKIYNKKLGNWEKNVTTKGMVK